MRNHGVRKLADVSEVIVLLHTVDGFGKHIGDVALLALLRKKLHDVGSLAAYVPHDFRRNRGAIRTLVENVEEPCLEIEVKLVQQRTLEDSEISSHKRGAIWRS